MAIAQTIAQDDPASPDAAPRDGVVTAGLPAAEAGGVLTVDLAAIVENWRSLSRKVMPTECAAVIKANAYGCGIEQVAGALARAGCKTFFVADLGEARRVRAVAGEPAIYVLNGLLPDSAAGYAEIRAQPVIGSLLEFAEWDGFCASSGWRGGAALHVDTGMNRLGIALGEASALAPRLRTESHSINLLMTHLACAEVFDHPLNQRQIATFRELRVLLSRHPLLDRQLVRHFPRQRRALRHGAAGRRALRGQSDPRPAQSDAPGGDVAGQDRAAAHGRARRDRRLRRRLDRRVMSSAWRWSPWAMPTAFRAR